MGSYRQTSELKESFLSNRLRPSLPVLEVDRTDPVAGGLVPWPVFLLAFDAVYGEYTASRVRSARTF